jgi:hypothetical protein
MNYKNVLGIAAVIFMVSACDEKPAQTQVRNIQAEKAQAAANEINFTDNAEIDNIKARLKLTSNPGLLGYIVLLNETGQHVMYEAVKGKITSGAKRLNPSDKVVTAGNGSGGSNMTIRAAPSDEGTFGQSGDYIFYYTQNGEYRQWNGKYLYSDQPFRLSVQPLIISASIK